MTRVCKICQSPDRAEIDAKLIDGVPYRSIALQYKDPEGNEHFSPMAVSRHKEHMRMVVNAHIVTDSSGALDDNVITSTQHSVTAATQADPEEIQPPAPPRKHHPLDSDFHNYLFGVMRQFEFRHFRTPDQRVWGGSEFQAVNFLKGLKGIEQHEQAQIAVEEALERYQSTGETMSIEELAAAGKV